MPRESTKYDKPFPDLFTPSEELTLDQIARCMGVTRERVRQIECKALGKLRKELLRRGYSLDDLTGQMEYKPDSHVTNDADSSFIE